MTRDDILKLARVVGFHSAVLLHIYDGRDGALTDQELAELRRIERFFRLAYESGAAAERAACADICDQHASIEGIAQRCAAEIRARGNK
jgi:hypothetical protein